RHNWRPVVVCIFKVFPDEKEQACVPVWHTGLLKPKLCRYLEKDQVSALVTCNISFFIAGHKATECPFSSARWPQSLAALCAIARMQYSLRLCKRRGVQLIDFSMSAQKCTAMPSGCQLASTFFYQTARQSYR